MVMMLVAAGVAGRRRRSVLVLAATLCCYQLSSLSIHHPSSLMVTTAALSTPRRLVVRSSFSFGSSSSLHSRIRRKNRRSSSLLLRTRSRHTMSSLSSTTTGDSQSQNQQQQQPSNHPPPTKLRFCDIGANLLDDRFTKGVYRGTFRHEPDLDCIIQRAIDNGVCRIVLTAGTISESRAAIKMARLWNTQYGGSDKGKIHFTCTVGVHPTRCQQVFEESNNDEDSSSDGEGSKKKKTADELLDELLELAKMGMEDGTVVAIGEIGLDYDRLQFCSKDIQQKYLKLQLEHVAQQMPTLPLFLHNRNANFDLFDILQEYSHCWKYGKGVVHSFDDTYELAQKFMNDDCGFYIGLNGCSLRKPDNLETVSKLPLDKILLETDCPYCDVRRTHAGYEHIQTHFESKAEKKFERGKLVKNRQEPCHIVQVAEIVAACQKVPLLQVADTCYANSLRLYNWTDNDDDHEEPS